MPLPTTLSSSTTHTDKIWCVDYNSTKNILATVGADQNLVIYSTKKDDLKILLKKSLKQQHNNRTLRRCSFSPCGNYLAVCSFDSTTSLWKIDFDQNSENADLQLEFWQILEGHENEVKSVSWSINGQFLATCSETKTFGSGNFSTKLNSTARRFYPATLKTLRTFLSLLIKLIF